MQLVKAVAHFNNFCFMFFPFLSFSLAAPSPAKSMSHPIPLPSILCHAPQHYRSNGKAYRYHYRQYRPVGQQVLFGKFKDFLELMLNPWQLLLHFHSQAV